MASASELMADLDQIRAEMRVDLDNLTVRWTCELDPSRLKRSPMGFPYTFVWATHDGSRDWLEFYMDGCGGRCGEEGPPLPADTFACAVSLGLEVSFNAALHPVPPPGRSKPVVRLSRSEKVALTEAVDAILRDPRSNTAGAADLGASASVPAAAASTDHASVGLEELLRLLQSQCLQIDAQREEQKAMGVQLQRLLNGCSDTHVTVGRMQEDIDRLQSGVDKFCDLSGSLKESARAQIGSYAAKNPVANENKLPTFGPRLQAKANVHERLDKFLCPVFGPEWETLHSSAPRQGNHTVHAMEKGSNVWRPYDPPLADAQLRRTLALYDDIRTRFADRPLGRATTAEVWAFIIESWGPREKWCRELGFSPRSEINIDHIHPKANGGDDSIFNYVLVEGPVNRFWSDNLGQHKRAWVGEAAWKISRAHTKIICDAGRLTLGAPTMF